MKSYIALLFLVMSSTTYANGGKPLIKTGAESVYLSTPVTVEVDLRDLPIVADWQPGDPIREIPRRYIPESQYDINPQTPGNQQALLDPLVEKQRMYNAKNPLSLNRAFNTTIISQDGSSSTGVSPPDTTGDVGITYYIHSYNGSGGSLYRIYNKATGNLVAGPLAMDAITPTTGNCSGGNGDPIILFDEMAGRWMISEFTASGNAMCVYISQTGDPVSGGWYVYEFIGASFPDYPKYGVWSDAYYIGTNESTSTLYALERTEMIAGNPASMQRFTETNLSGFGFQMIVPADHDGSNAPKAGAPGLFMRHMDDEVHSGSCGGNASQDCLQLWDFNVDWVTPANSNISGPINVLVSNFDSDLCGFGFVGCVPQPGTTRLLDPLREVIMWRLQYRNFGSYETLVANLETDVNGSDKHGIRWFELRRTTGLTASDWSLHQEGTWSDSGSSNKWMGSASMDASGNIALAYSTSSGTAGDFPSLKYAGRQSTDALNILTSGEHTIINGTASQTGNIRWGDYSSMGVDPVDGCTFWFSSEYTPSSSWRTHMSSFKFDSCGNPGYTLAVAPINIEVCVNPSPANAPNVTVSTTSVLGFSDPINLGFNPVLPTGFSSTFSVDPVTPGNNSILTLTVNNTASAGTHTITVEGDASGEIEQDSFDVLVSFPVSASPTLVSPFNGETNVAIFPTFNWNTVVGASNYEIDIATDAAFVSIVETATTATNTYTVSANLNPNTQYYWRVRAINSCGAGSYSSSSFTTANLTTVSVCSTPNVSIPDNNAAGITDTLTFNQDIAITDVNITIETTHTYVGDLKYTIANVGTATSSLIIDRPGGGGCGNNDIDTTIDDDNGTPVENACSGTPPAIGTGPFTPNNPLSVFDGEAALNNWSLNVSDNANQDNGVLVEWCVVITGVPVVAQPDITLTGTNLNQDVCLNPGPTNANPITLSVSSVNGYNNPVTLAFNPVLPTGITGAFSVNPVNPVPTPGTQSILNLTVGNTATAGNNLITVEASGVGVSTKSLNLNLNVIYGLSTIPTATTPVDGSIGVATNTSFTWSAIIGADSYDIDISQDPLFATIDFTANVVGTTYTPGSALLSGTDYYWRVRAANQCGNTNYTIAAFETLGSNGTTTSTTCNSNSFVIPDNNLGGVDSVITITPGGTITDIDITLDVTHTYVGDLIAQVTNNTTSTNVIVMDRPGYTGTGFGCSGSNIDTTLDDVAASAVETECAGGTPTIGTGPFSPNNLLSAYNTENSASNWTLNISDNASSDTGTLNEWCVVATIDAGSSVAPADYSDLSSTYGMAKHEGGGISKLGNNWTADNTFSQDVDAPDDDGVTASGLWLPNSTTAQLSVVSNGGYLACWFDWDNDGTFANGEKTVAQNIASGTVVIPVTIPLTSTFGSGGDDFLETRCRFYTTEPLVRATETVNGSALTGEVEDYRFPANQLTPITLAYSTSTMRNSNFSLEWSTTTETGTIAYNISGFKNGVWKLLNVSPITAKGVNSVVPHDYNFNSNHSSIELYKIIELTTQGIKHEYGPFVTNLEYGKYPANQRINWHGLKTQSRELKQQRQNVLKGTFDFIKINVDKTGIQRISYDDLVLLGVDLQGVNSGEISISFENNRIARYVSSDIFGVGEYIEFVGNAAKTLYTDTNVYILSLTESNVKPATIVNSQIPTIDTNAYYIATSKIDEDLAYSFASPANTPWFNTSLLVYTSENSWQFPLSTKDIIDNGVPAHFSYIAWGGTDFQNQEIDHHIRVSINNHPISDVFGSGLEVISDEVDFQVNQLQASNTITITMPADTGLDYDLVQLDSMVLNYPSEIYAQSGELQFSPKLSSLKLDTIFDNGFEELTFDKGFKVKGFNQQNIRSYATDGDKLYYFDSAVVVQNGSEYDVELPYISSSNLVYHVTQDSKVAHPTLDFANQTNNSILQGDFDYLMITHPDFTQTLGQLVSYHESKGVKVKVVETNDIYALYSHHRIEAAAIKAFIKDAQKLIGINTVLLVGSDTSDYLDNLAIGSISYLPTLYNPTDENIRFAPVDPLFVDINDDYIPDLALGRLPVRSIQSLQNIINKIILFESRQYAISAIFAADRDPSFDVFSDQMIDLLPSNWQVSKAYLNQLEVNGTQSSLINEIEVGVTLTNFFGHSGPSTWSFEHMFDSNDVQALNNVSKPTLINQFGCWNTYYVMPQFNTMAHHFMQLENRGAVAVMGASTLTESFHESELGNHLIPLLAQPNTTIGEAILQAKQQLAQNHPEYKDVILGWTLLGDPLIEIN